MIVVSDASPLIALAAVDRLDLLHQLFGHVIIPTAVHDEVFGGKGPYSALPDYIRVESVRNEAAARFLKMNLHPGESEAIALALENGGSLVIIDDKQARETAARLEMKVVGTLGVLILAKQKGVIGEVRPLIQQMIERIAFRIAPEVLSAALVRIGETTDQPELGSGLAVQQGGG